MNTVIKELSNEEMVKVNGGGFWAWLGLGFLYDIVSNPSESWASLKAGYSDGQR